MGGQACVLYGAAEYSRDLDLAVLATDDGIAALRAALEELGAGVIAVPPFRAEFLRRGHAVHFGVPAPVGQGTWPLRVDVMSTLRGVAPFPELWERRSTLALDDDDGRVVEVDIMALPDLVQAKKTQRDKDWPMIRRLVDASYAVGVDRGEPTAEQVTFWLRELRTPEFLRDAVVRFPAAAHSGQASGLTNRPRRRVHRSLWRANPDRDGRADQTELAIPNRRFKLVLARRHQDRPTWQ